eukprot:1147790-Pelagomonas_calceolata.AAC.2
MEIYLVSITSVRDTLTSSHPDANSTSPNPGYTLLLLILQGKWEPPEHSKKHSNEQQKRKIIRAVSPPTTKLQTGSQTLHSRSGSATRSNSKEHTKECSKEHSDQQQAHRHCTAEVGAEKKATAGSILRSAANSTATSNRLTDTAQQQQSSAEIIVEGNLSAMFSWIWVVERKKKSAWAPEALPKLIKEKIKRRAKVPCLPFTKRKKKSCVGRGNCPYTN